MTAPAPHDTDRPNVVSAQHKPTWRLTTKITLSGYRFLKRRLRHAIVRGNTEMWDDPMRNDERDFNAGIVITVIVVLACVLMAYLRPQGTAGGAQLLQDTATGKLFVLENDGGLRPVYNLTSARLIIGQHQMPRRVKPEELAKHPLGQTAGIPGAPYDTPTVSATSSYWTVCDTVDKPASMSPAVVVSVLADQPEYGLETSTKLSGAQALLAKFRGQTYLIDDTGRHLLDLANTAVTTAINLPPGSVAAPLSPAMFNALPASDPLIVPLIGDAGAPNTIGLAPDLVIGTVITDSANPATRQMYVVLADGLAKINPATAAALRNTNNYNHVDPPIVPTDKISAIAPRTYPSALHEVTIIDRATQPVLCWAWAKTGAASASPQIAIAAGKQIPLPADKLNIKGKQITTGVRVYQTGAGRDGTNPTGRYVRVINPTPQPENRFYIDTGGVRYGLPDPKAEKALGLSDPQLAPWPVVGLLAGGPNLTEENALLEHDTLPADPFPRLIKSK
ncbi:type VII secretion protein EccB [Mycobacteroides abscessus]|uniref:type VII secretion protein EccB n=1 Tax=Mycobacteroides abscessus TaxID=36809 RepID=UPI002105431E|nr:type VII secretion protein EccB [Mycobacteroides abscessus]